MFHNYKKLILLFGAVLLAGLLFGVAWPALAQGDLRATVGESLTKVREAVGFADIDLETMILRVIQVALGLLGLIAIIIIMYGGFIWMTSGGLRERVERAKQILKNGVIGLAIIILAYAIVVFVFRILLGMLGPGGGVGEPGPPSWGSHLGQIGGGIVESVYPKPGARDVPRDTMIFVTFREAMDPSSIIDGGRMKNVTISETADPKNIVAAAAYVSADNRTFSFAPETYLGDGQNHVQYTVTLGKEIKKANGDPAFPGLQKPFAWSFVVGTRLDLRPPQVENVWPKKDFQAPKNVIIQINFDEEMFPPNVSGRVTVTDPDGDGVGTTPSFFYITVQADMDGDNSFGDNEYVAGVWEISSDYKTVEFRTEQSCGNNSCGDIIYCLPASDSGPVNYRVTVKAAALKPCAVAGSCGEAGPAECCRDPDYKNCFDSVCQKDDGTNYPKAGMPASGVVDAANNSLDGNKDGDADGPGDDADNYVWEFKITNDIKAGAPKIEEIGPGIQAEDVDLAASIEAKFDSKLWGATLRPGETEICDQGNVCQKHQRVGLYQENATCPNGDDCIGWMIEKKDEADDKTKVLIIHPQPFVELYKYGPEMGSGIKDIYQNCFTPSEGPNATGGSCNTSAAAPYCCEGQARAGACQ